MKHVIEMLIDLPYYTEGPVTDGNGNIFFTTLSGGTVISLQHDGSMIDWAACTCPNGQAITENDDHLVCDSKDAAVYRFSNSGELLKAEVMASIAGKELFV